MFYLLVRVPIINKYLKKFKLLPYFNTFYLLIHYLHNNILTYIYLTSTYFTYYNILTSYNTFTMQHTFNIYTMIHLYILHTVHCNKAFSRNECNSKYCVINQQSLIQLKLNEFTVLEKKAITLTNTNSATNYRLQM